MLYAVLGLISALITATSFYMYVSGRDNKLIFGAAILFLIVTIACFGMFLSGRVNKSEDIHITE